MPIVDEDQVDDFIDEDRTLTQEIKYSITSYGADFLVDGLVSRYATGDIYVPDFQRDFVWTRPQASRFIESILLGLPVPGIFLYREAETNKFLIVDGLQRISTLVAFLTGIFPGSDRPFSLEKVYEKYSGRTYEELEPEDQRQINNTVIHATIFQQTQPLEDENEKSSIYLIFERLNTGGTPLQPQEIRTALYHGEFAEFLSKLNEIQSWRNVFGPRNKRRKDEELILRFLAFLCNFEHYSSPMVRFLNGFMGRNRHLDRLDRRELTKIFTDTFSFIDKTLGAEAFRPVRNLNAAVFDSVSVTVARHALYERLDEDAFRSRYAALLLDETFIKNVSKSTSDAKVVRDRFGRAEEILAH